MIFRWDFYPEQFLEPVYLEAGLPYYFEMLANNYGGPWQAGIGAKLHDSTLMGGLYDGDRESQEITISSTTVQERQVVMCVHVHVHVHVHVDMDVYDLSW